MYLITVNHVLKLPDFDQPFRIETDASQFGIGGVLSQKHNGYWRPVAYYSKHLSKTEKNYSTIRKRVISYCIDSRTFQTVYLW
jgi:hypothetical protein